MSESASTAGRTSGSRHSSRIAAACLKRPASAALSPPRSPKQRRVESSGEASCEFVSRRRLHLYQLRDKHIELLKRLQFLEMKGAVVDFERWREESAENATVSAMVRGCALDVREVETRLLQHGNAAVASTPEPSVTADHRPHTAPPPILAITPDVSQIDGDMPTPRKESVVVAESAPVEAPQPATPVEQADLPKREVVQQPPVPRSVAMATPLHVDVARPSSTASAAESTVERAAKHEAAVTQRINELRRQGMWTQRMMPRCADPPRAKAHHDYLLDEARWMHADFKQEHRFKRAAARKFAQLCSRVVREEREEVERVKVDQLKEAKRTCASIARQIRSFWKSVDRVVEHKSQDIIEAKKRKALDQHLDFILSQTERYSGLVQEGLTRTTTPTSAPSGSASVCSRDGGDDDDDGNFEASSSSDDDEATISHAEEQLGADDVASEVAALQAECDMDVDDWLALLPAGYLEQRCADEPTPPADSNDASVSTVSPSADDDGEAAAAGASAESFDGRLEDIAERALEFQPTGCTLSETKVVTKVPFLLRHELREYQHVGLDWLVALNDKALNGILADEMGLGKTIQTIALLAHLACDKANWGPHLIVVPTSVLLNWEMEFKKWCPAFKILTYYGSLRDRREKRTGWSKPNAFHVCITSYKLVVQDIRAFRQKRWKYFILDEAQNIKNFKSQRWQSLLKMNAERRLLLTGTPLQNSLMELWSLMHFLMPALFASHRDFRDWFSNPLTGMVEGSHEYNSQVVQRLHKVLRPFILRRLKAQVEKQMPHKFEHVRPCYLSKRQRFLYDDFMSRSSTRDKLASGGILSVLNILMQLRKCCNHPNLFEPRPVLAPLAVHRLDVHVPALVCNLTRPQPVDAVTVPRCLLLGDRRHRQLSRKDHLLTEVERAVPPPTPRVGGFTFTSASASADASRQPQPPLNPSCSLILPRSVADSTSMGSSFFLCFDDKVQDVLPVVVDPDKSLLERIGVPSQHSACRQGTTATFRLQPPTPTARSLAGGVAAVLQPLDGLPAPPPVQPPPPPLIQPIAPRISVVDVGVPYVGATTKNFRKTPPAAMINWRPPPSARHVVSLPSWRPPPRRDADASPVRAPTAMSPVRARLGGAVTVSGPPPLKAARLVPPLAPSSAVIPAPPSPPTARTLKWRKEMLSSRAEASERFSRVVSLPVVSPELLKVLRVSESDVCDETIAPLRSWLSEVADRFSTSVAPVVAAAPVLTQTGRDGQRAVWLAADLFDRWRSEFVIRPLVAPFRRSLLFPERRLIEYDCGKLQSLNDLLKTLYAGGHRCLIFTQMSRMLDIFETFLSYHGYKYVRLDGATKIEHRQALMERFNSDEKIFCFILSTRSGGLGVNLTGADTVIFYDSDWNPTMDAQAQDRCHRIGQTRDVHIYRLISEKTVEENILKKATQKKRLGEIAIENAGFTADFFKQSNIRDLFGLDATAADAPADAPTERDLEQAMANVEDAPDAAAARQASDEVVAEAAEFDESHALPNGDADHPEVARVQAEYEQLVQQLKPVERYAMKFLEGEYKPDFEEELRQTQLEMDQQKAEWAREHAAALRKEEERLTREQQAEFSLTYPADANREVVKRPLGRRSSAAPAAADVAKRRGRPRRSAAAPPPPPPPPVVANEATRLPATRGARQSASSLGEYSRPRPSLPSLLGRQKRTTSSAAPAVPSKFPGLS